MMRTMRPNRLCLGKAKRRLMDNGAGSRKIRSGINRGLTKGFTNKAGHVNGIFIYFPDFSLLYLKLPVS